MNKLPRLFSVAGVSVLSVLGFCGAPGCSDSKQSGTTVQKTPEAVAGEKASMEFMRKNMAKEGYMPKK